MSVTINWPASLPQYVETTYKESPPDSRIRTPTDMGPPKVRRRYSAAYRPVSCTIKVDSTQLDAFDLFFVTTTESGTLPFNFPNPRGEGTVVARFAEKVPSYGEFVAKYSTITFDLEILP